MPKTAEQILEEREIKPTTLKSEDIRVAWPAQMRRRSFFSARTSEAAYLKRLKEVCLRVASGEVSEASGTASLRDWIATVDPETPMLPKEGVAEKTSLARMDLILKTQREMAHSQAQLAVQDEETLALWPAWRLKRFGTRKIERDWPKRWEAAGKACGWVGASKDEMVALKDSPIWAELGHGAGGYRDGLDNPFPPFAFSSGMDWEPVSTADCERLGIDVTAQKPKGGNFSPDNDEVTQAVKRLGPEFMAALKKDLGI